MSKIAFITCEEKPALTPDDAVLSGALTRGGHTVTPIPWSRQTDWSEFDLILIRSAWDYHLRAGEFAAWVRQMQALSIPVFNNPELLLWNMHKGYLLELEKKGVRIPPTVMVTKTDASVLENILQSNGWNKAVVKPAVSATAHQTWVTTVADAQTNQEKFATQLREGDVLVQAFMNEVTDAGELSLIYFGGEFSHAVRKRARKGDFRVQSDFGGTAEKVEVSTAVVAKGLDIIRCAPRAPLYARVDGILSTGFVLMELELIEPYLFFNEASGSAMRLCQMVELLLKNGTISASDLKSEVLDAWQIGQVSMGRKKH